MSEMSRRDCRSCARERLARRADHGIEACKIARCRARLISKALLETPLMHCPSFLRLTLAAAAAALAVSACQSRDRAESSDSGLLGGLFGGGSRSVSDQAEAGIGVNSYLWRSSLDVLSFMPLSEVDPFGGVIITDWYSNPEAPTERFRATVFILDTRLRADALSVQIFKQLAAEDGRWVDAAVDPATRIQIENAILTRARQLRISQIQG